MVLTEVGAAAITPGISVATSLGVQVGGGYRLGV